MDVRNPKSEGIIILGETPVTLQSLVYTQSFKFSTLGEESTSRVGKKILDCGKPGDIAFTGLKTKYIYTSPVVSDSNGTPTEYTTCA